MARKSLVLLLAIGTALAIIVADGDGFPAEKLKFGTSVKEYPPYYLAVMAAQEKGFWKENGLEVEWISFRNPVEQMQAVAAGVFSIGMTGSSVQMQSAAGGLPVIIVSVQYERPDFVLWVMAHSRFKDPKDLKGAKIGVGRLGAPAHVYGRVISRAAGVEKEVRFVGTGGVPEGLALLRTGAVEAIVNTPFQLIMLKVTGQVRDLAAVSDYLPKEWVEQVVFAHRELIKTRPEAIRRAVKAVLKANQFVLSTPAWAIEKMKENSGYSEEAARIMHGQLALSKTGRVPAKAMENTRNFYIEFGLVPKDKAPPVDELYTTRFID